MIMRKEKYCPGCKKTLPRSAFGTKGKSKVTGEPYLITRCKNCHNKYRKTLPNAEYLAKWRNKNRVAFNSYMREWRRANPDAVLDRREAYRLGSKQKVQYITPEQWDKTFTHFGCACAYCGSKDHLEMDHFVPLVKGGRATSDNLVPACRKCNRSKAHSNPLTFLDVQTYLTITTYLFSLMT